MCMIENGYLVLVGSTESFTSPWTQVYVMKMDTLGNAIWDIAFGGPMDDRGYGVCPAHDSGVVVTGNAGILNGSDQVYLVKIGSNGNIIWETNCYNTYGARQSGWSIYPTREGGYIIGARTHYSLTQFDALLIRVNALGDTIGCAVIGMEDDDYLNSIIQTSDGGFVFAGFSHGSNGYWQPWVVKTDSLGSVLWNRIYDTHTTGIAWDIIETSDGNYVFTGYTGFAEHRSIFLSKIDGNGDYIWNHVYDYPVGLYIEQVGKSVQETKDGGFIIGGFCRYWNYGGMLLKTNGEGDSLWTAYLEQTNERYQINKVIQSRSGKYYAGGAVHYEDDFFLAAFACDMPEMSLTPIGAPIQIPSTGGMLSYELNITNTTENCFTCDIWNGVERSGGQSIEPGQLRQNIALTPGATYNRILQQWIPGFIPSGILTYYVKIGGFPEPYYTQDSFRFMKNPEEIDDNNNDGHDVLSVNSHSLRFTIKEPGNVRIEIYNIQGKEVAEVFNDYCLPGSYKLSMNLNSLPSGIYFLRMQTSVIQRVRKILLVK